jgi:YidC/Oxa1 family membrane protein insertase
MFSFFGSLWHEYLYTPLFNVLIWFYNGPADRNLGIAVIFLTISLRLIIFPLTILSERNKHIYEKMEKEIAEIERAYKNDEEKQKDRIRELLKSHHVSPYSRTASLVLQALVFVLLYQVFMGGIKANHYAELYDWVARPDAVFTTFLKTDLGERSWIWSGIVGVWLYLELASAARRNKQTNVTRADQFYRIAFPLFSFLALFLLPSVKSIFILTSMAFSFIIASLRKTFFKVKA